MAKNFFKKFFISIFLLMLSYAQISSAQQQGEELKDLKKDIGTLKEDQKTILKELDEIKKLLQAKPAAAQLVQPVDVELSVDGDPFKGDKNAPLTLVEFSDFQCPFCGQYVRQTLPQIENEYIKTGKVKYVFRDFPLQSIHKDAFKAAEAAQCAGAQGKYWEMHDLLFNNQKALSPDNLSSYAKDLALDLSKFKECLDSGKSADGIRKDLEEGQKSGMKGTPSFFLGYTDPNSQKIKAKKFIRGATPYPTFKEAIEGLLSSKK